MDLAGGAQYSLGSFVPDQVRNYGTNVTGLVLPRSGHWIREEQPTYMINYLESSLGTWPTPSPCGAPADRNPPLTRAPTDLCETKTIID
ncbi:hypothetical protein [Streptomyces sp. NPDC002265]|uniref:hypothetical protein n=1 Tax=Streptomyces sp. NPDC002265 TaxID=3154415 RepID=UPI003325480F